MQLHIFNPEHDIALAVNRKRFTAPRAALQLRRDLGYLPMLWAGTGDLVLVDDVAAAREGLQRLGIDTEGQLVCRADLQARADCVAPEGVCPWGWDAAVRQELLACGLPEGILPSEAQLQTIRSISHRGWAAKHLLPRLRRLADTVGRAYEVCDVGEVETCLRAHGRIVVKEPWSSSGRGVYRVEAVPAVGGTALLPRPANRITRVLAGQGSIMVEPWYDKVVDFAMEFVSDGRGGAQYLGLSLFHTAAGAYTGNILADEACKRRMLSRYMDVSQVDALAAAVCAEMGRLLSGRYAGCFGVDMMVVNRDGRMMVHPCVELNLRRTMGHVALALSHSEVCPEGTMQVRFDNGFRLVMSQK